MRKTGWQGFTLLELMVVLVIVAIVTAIAVVSYFGFERGRRLHNVAVQMNTLVVAAREQAIIYPAVLGLNIRPHGYQFFRFRMRQQKGQWQPFQSRLFTQAVSLPDGIDLCLIRKNKCASVSTVPQIIFQSSGEMTPFMLKISQGKQYYQLQGLASGQIRYGKS